MYTIDIFLRRVKRDARNGLTELSVCVCVNAVGAGTIKGCSVLKLSFGSQRSST